MTSTLADLIAYLNNLAGPAPMSELLERVRRLRIDAAEVAGHIAFDDSGYVSSLVHAGPWHEIFVFCWKSGQRSSVHDHRGTHCAVRVLRGVATETYYEPTANGRLFPLPAHELRPGDVSGRRDLEIHEIANLQPGARELVTLHVYSPPMGEVGVYGPERLTTAAGRPRRASSPA